MMSGMGEMYLRFFMTNNEYRIVNIELDRTFDLSYLGFDQPNIVMTF